MNITFRADATERMGTGHLFRCLALAQAALQVGDSTSLERYQERSEAWAVLGN